MRKKILLTIIFILVLIASSTSAFAYYYFYVRTPQITITSNHPEISSVTMGDKSLWDKFLKDIDFTRTDFVYEQNSPEDKGFLYTIRKPINNYEIILTNERLSSAPVYHSPEDRVITQSRKVEFDYNTHKFTIKIYINPVFFPKDKKYKEHYINNAVAYAFAEIATSNISSIHDTKEKPAEEYTNYLNTQMKNIQNEF